MLLSCKKREEGSAVHIPKGTTGQCDLPPFEELLKEARTPGHGYDCEKWLYVPARYEEYRYILATTGQKPLICIGVNPSTAAPGDLDNTLKSVERIALGNGFDSFVMFNLYAQRATDPDSMEKEFNEYLHAQNMAAFTYILQNAGERPAVWAAWGTVIEKRAYLTRCAADMYKIGQSFGARWYTCGQRSKKGHPHHPLYLKKDALLEEFDLASYVETIGMNEAKK